MCVCICKKPIAFEFNFFTQSYRGITYETWNYTKYCWPAQLTYLFDYIWFLNLYSNISFLHLHEEEKKIHPPLFLLYFKLVFWGIFCLFIINACRKKKKKTLLLSWNTRIMQFCFVHIKWVLTGYLTLRSAEISLRQICGYRWCFGEGNPRKPNW